MAQGLWPALRRLDWTYIFFIALVTVTQLMLATWGILARYLQVHATAGTPPPLEYRATCTSGLRGRQHSSWSKLSSDTCFGMAVRHTGSLVPSQRPYSCGSLHL